MNNSFVILIIEVKAGTSFTNNFGTYVAAVSLIECGAA